MKKLLIALILITLPAMAAESEKTKLCTEYHELSTTVMRMRQDNVDMSLLINALEGNDIGIKLVMLAYKEPRYSVEKNQANKVKDFANSQMMRCLSSVEDK